MRLVSRFPIFFWVDPCRRTAFYSAKHIKVNLLLAFRDQIGVDEGCVAELILGIVVDILKHVPIHHEQSSDVGGTAASPWDFAALDASQFVVLLPQIAFDDFDRGQEPENGYVALCEKGTSFLGEGR